MARTSRKATKAKHKAEAPSNENAPVPKKRSFVWLSTQDWDDVWTRKQRFAQLLARRGHPVLYVEAPTHLLTRELPGR